MAGRGLSLWRGQGLGLWLGGEVWVRVEQWCCGGGSVDLVWVFCVVLSGFLREWWCVLVVYWVYEFFYFLVVGLFVMVVDLWVASGGGV